MRKIDYKYIISSKIKYIKARLQKGGRIDDYFRVKNENELAYKKMIDKLIDMNTSNDEKCATKADILKIREKVCKYGAMVTWESWKEHKIAERKRMEDAIFIEGELIKEYPNEITFYRKNKKLELFPYDFTDIYKKKEDYIEVCVYDENLKYVIHNGKKLFFPTESDSAIRRKYIQLIMEQDAHSPHKYFTDEVVHLDKTVFIDVGAAEGIISLDLIDNVSEVILLECSEKWINALEHTFEPWVDKVRIIRKYVGISTSSNSISLDDLLEGYEGRNIIIKMDIEGMELEALLGGEKVLDNNNCVISCATYHTSDMYADIERYLKNKGYICEPSEGVMLFFYGNMTMLNGRYEQNEYPYFRKGIIRARKCAKQI